MLYAKSMMAISNSSLNCLFFLDLTWPSCWILMRSSEQTALIRRAHAESRDVVIDHLSINAMVVCQSSTEPQSESEVSSNTSLHRFLSDNECTLSSFWIALMAFRLPKFVYASLVASSIIRDSFLYKISLYCSEIGGYDRSISALRLDLSEDHEFGMIKASEL
ncbi:hypothetical protein OGAPHI_003395 [Ogataea philodendri]|uniref:Uncharacterized protein n=1 Tax=Ogataea philodendri TaxID=1378263 RepID=A0A9P8P830_9ASCO|nr:uncharacterized protein OGAPHI_003395 [Ogataea philodendri]KAH3666945.1 hypothetical protein OGAPHI_003395 [Ogataea philodendri]